MNFISRIFTIVICICWVNSSCFGILSVNIDGGDIQPINVAILGFQNNPKIEEVIVNDLKNCGFFKVSKLQLESVSIENRPDFDIWMKSDINFLVTSVVIEKDDVIEIKYRIWNIFSKKHVFGKDIKIDRNKWRQLSHMVADDVYEAGTNDNGYFNTRILYVAESGPFDKRIKRLAIIDYDGENHGYLTDKSHMILTPRISPDNKKIMYMSFAGKIPKVNLYDRSTGGHYIVGNFDGMTSAPRFGFGTNIALLALSKDGHTNIHKFDINTAAQKQLTTNEYINTSPSYSPDNKFIVFNSDRSGAPQLYVMRNDGSDQKRVSFGRGRYMNPVWSPKGDYIAFIKTLEGAFYLGIMRPNGTDEKILASGYMIESPSWAPNGRLLVFSTTSRYTESEPKTSRLYMVDITSRFHRMINVKEDATDPMWSSRVSFN